MLRGSIIHPIALAAILLLVVNGGEGIIYTRCQLAQTLYRNYRFSRNTLANWVCLIEAESGRNTRAISGSGGGGGMDYGLFKINSIYWCSGGPGSRSNTCRVQCSALRNDNIADDVRCARIIYSRMGFNAWNGWRRNCKGRNVQSYITNCKL